MIQAPATLPDELAAGYRTRVRITSGLDPSQFRRSVRQSGESWLSVLADSARMSMAQFAQMHTLLPFRNAFHYEAAGRAHGTWEPESVQLRMALALIQPGPRVCASCIEEDRQFWGFPYFRRTHHLPGVDWCIKHTEPLSRLLDGALDDLPVHHSQSTRSRREVEAELACAAIRRFADISAGLLVKEVVANEADVMLALHEAADDSQIDLSSPGFGELLTATFPHSWLQQLLQARYSSRGEQRIDRISLQCSWPKSKPTVIYVLALASLFGSADEALCTIVGNRSGQAGVVAASEHHAADKPAVMARLVAAARRFQAGMSIDQAAGEQEISPAILEEYVRAGFTLSQPADDLRTSRAQVT